MGRRVLTGARSRPRIQPRTAERPSRYVGGDTGTRSVLSCTARRSTPEDAGTDGDDGNGQRRRGHPRDPARPRCIGPSICARACRADRRSCPSYWIYCCSRWSSTGGPWSSRRPCWELRRRRSESAYRIQPLVCLTNLERAEYFGDGTAVRTGNFTGDVIAPTPDYAKLADAYGGSGERIASAEAIPASLERALATLGAGRRTLLDVFVEP
jgi:hypothetical protein